MHKEQGLEQFPLVVSRNVVRFARHMAGFTVSNWGYDGLADSVELIVSELVTNAAQAALAAGLTDDPQPWDVTSDHRILLTLQRQEDEVVICLEDRLPGVPRMRAAEEVIGDSNSNHASDDDSINVNAMSTSTRTDTKSGNDPLAALAQLEEHGRGLLLIAHLSTAWGYYPTGRGKVVWCRVRANGETAAEEEGRQVREEQLRSPSPWNSDAHRQPRPATTTSRDAPLLKPCPPSTGTSQSRPQLPRPWNEQRASRPPLPRRWSKVRGLDNYQAVPRGEVEAATLWRVLVGLRNRRP
ncbi:ATP-binding protein [Nocardiopsis sp. LOL_012]|uniref:ATP-binding protein n=1 Tax=Nocardiopsis sp. LOL_012 TaxID=3345409 RepID=UPI003A8C06AC